MSNRIWMSLIMDPIGPEQLESFALEFGKIAAFDYVYSLASTNINQSAVQHQTWSQWIWASRSQMSLIMSQVIPDQSDQSVLPALEIEKLNFNNLFGIYFHVNLYWLCLGGSVVSVSDSWPGGCEFDPRLRRLFFPAYFRLSPLQKHVRKVVSGFGKKSCVSMCEKARKHICVTDRHDMTLAVKVA